MAERNANGTFAKGNKSASGRPRDDRILRRYARERTQDALDVIIGIMNDTSKNSLGQYNISPNTRLRAAEIILDRGYGKPATSVITEEGHERTPITIEYVSADVDTAA